MHFAKLKNKYSYLNTLEYLHNFQIDKEFLLDCLTQPCMSEIIQRNHPGMPSKCADCVVSKAFIDNQSNAVVIKSLSDDQFHVYLNKCLDEGCNPVKVLIPSSPTPTPSPVSVPTPSPVSMLTPSTRPF